MITLEKVRLDLVQNYEEDFLEKMDIIIFEINNCKLLNGNVVISLFLLYISRFVSVDFFKEIALFCVLYQKMMNKIGYKSQEVIFKGDKKDDFC